MKRTAFAICLLCLAATGLLFGKGGGQQVSTWGDMTLSGVQSLSLTRGEPYDTLVALSKTTLKAVIADRGITVEAKRLDATIDAEHKVAHTTKLSGGVTGTITRGTPGDMRDGTFTGETVVYTNRADVDPEGSDFDATGGVTFKEVLEKRKANVTIAGSHGLFQVRTIAQAASLSSADVDGPIAFGVVSVGTSKGKTTHFKLDGKGDHLTLRRVGANGTEYEVKLTGHVTYAGSGELGSGSGGCDVLTIHLDANFDLINFNADNESGVVTPQGKGSS